MSLRAQLLSGLVIPAHPLALNREHRLDERRQRALTRYYMAAGAGGIARAPPWSRAEARAGVTSCEQLARGGAKPQAADARQRESDHARRAWRFGLGAFSEVILSKRVGAC